MQQNILLLAHFTEAASITERVMYLLHVHSITAILFLALITLSPIIVCSLAILEFHFESVVGAELFEHLFERSVFALRVKYKALRWRSTMFNVPVSSISYPKLQPKRRDHNCNLCQIRSGMLCTAIRHSPSLQVKRWQCQRVQS